MPFGFGSRSDDAVRRQAAQWVTLVHDPEASVDRAAFERWRAKDPRHALAYARAERAWDQSGLLAQTRSGRARGLTEPRRWIDRSGSRYGVAAMLALLIGMVGLAMFTILPVDPSVEGGPTELASRIGEIRTVALADGSRVTLDTDTLLHIAFRAGERRLILTRGRARFDVTHDASRPFIVMADGGSVTAVGTMFDVSVTGRNVMVALLRGVIDVRGSHAVGAGPHRTAAVRLQAGQQIAFDPSSSPSNPRPRIVAEQSWTSGMLSFDRTPLDEAIAEANRYSSTKIRVADPKLNALRVTGAYRAGDAKGLALAVAASLGLRVELDPRGDFILTARHDSP